MNKRIALTGGIACGKSLVARYLNELGVETIDADDIVHEILPDPVERKRIAAEVFANPEKRKELEAKLHPIVKAKITTFLSQSPRPESKVAVAKPREGRAPSRPQPRQSAALPNGNGCFATTSKVSSRESFTITRGGRTLDFRLSTLAEDSGLSTLAEDSGPWTLGMRIAIIPLLFETHWDADYDIICCVSSERSVQIDRMMTTRGYSREDAEARLAAQLPVAEKAAKSHYIIENNGSAEELKTKVAQFLAWLRDQV